MQSGASGGASGAAAAAGGGSGVSELFQSLDRSPESVVQEIKQLIQEQFSEGELNGATDTPGN